MSVRWIDQSDKTERLLIRGKDRVKTLHNLTTADVKHLKPAQGTEAFITSLQGKTLAYIRLIAGDEGLIMLADAGTWTSIRDHVAKYAVFDETTWEDLTPATRQVHLRCEESLDPIAQTGLFPIPERRLTHQDGATPHGLVRIVRESPLGGAGLTLLGEPPAVDSVMQRLAESLPGFDPLSASQAEALRVAAGTPHLGQEITPDRFPQELGRDPLAISFTKGCYLGQETVARIDALGHVNRILRGLRFSGPPPDPGAKLTDEADKDVGWITSVAIHPELGSIGLGFLRTPHITPGAQVVVQIDQLATGRAEVCALPMA